jgi:hypothetical protein
MWRSILVCVVGVAFTACAPLSTNGQEPKKPAAPTIKGGIEGKVKKVDPEKMTLTITTAGRERTFTITEDTTMVGPRGGVVRRGLKDPRFHEGMELTVVATGTTAKEVHLGFDRQEPSATVESAAKPATGGAASKAKEPTKEAAEEDKIYPGKIKSVDSARHMLVISLLNGQERSFMIAKDVKLSVKGTISKKGLEDPALTAGTPVNVITDSGGHKVKEVNVAPATARKKAG